MGKSMNIFRILKLFKVYRGVVRSIKNDLYMDLDLKVDKAYRLYKVYTFPSNDLSDAYKSSTGKFVKAEIKKEIDYIKSYLITKNLMEVTGVYDIVNKGNFNYLIIFGFMIEGNSFRSDDYYKFLIWFYAILILLVLIISVVLTLVLII